MTKRAPQGKLRHSVDFWAISSPIKMNGLVGVMLLTLSVLLGSVSPDATVETAAATHDALHFDQLKTQFAAELMALEKRLQSTHNERVESAESKFLQEVTKLKKSLDSSSKGSGKVDALRQQVETIQNEVNAINTKLDKTNEKIRQLQAENITLRQKLESLKEDSLSAQWKAWREYLSDKMSYVLANSSKYTDAAKSFAFKASDFVQEKSVWLIDHSKTFYDQYLQYVFPYVVKSSERLMAWIQETHQKWRPTLDQQVYKLHVLIQQSKFAEYHLEKYVTVETITAISVVLFSVFVRVALSLCCRRSRQTQAQTASSNAKSSPKH